VAKRHALGLRTARENIADLCDEGSFIEYGALAVAAQAPRRSADDLMRNTPADGMVTGIGSVNGALFGPERRAVVMAYDATVLAGTQGMRNHQKTDRLLGIALAAQAAGGAVCRRRRRPARATPTCRSWPACMCHLCQLCAAERPGARGGHRVPAAALPATPRCWAAAT
jgi:hypothetical protein